MKPQVVSIALLLGLLPSTWGLLKNCVTPAEWSKDQIDPKCEIVTKHKFDCLEKNKITVERPQQGDGVTPEETRIVCKAPYPIDVDVEGVKIKGFPGILFTRRCLDNCTSKFEYTVTVPLVIKRYSARWWKIFSMRDKGVRTEFYLFQPSSSDRILPYDRRSEKQVETIVMPDSRYAILPCTVNNPKDAGIVKLFKHGESKREIPVDNSTLRYDTSIGFILDTTPAAAGVTEGTAPAPSVWGTYICQVENPSTSNTEKLEITLLKPEDFVPLPASKSLRTFTDRPLTLACKSKHPIAMEGTRNGISIAKSHFKLTQNDSAILKYVGVLESGDLAPKLEAFDELQVTCAANANEGGSGSSSHTWRVQVLDPQHNDVVQATIDGQRIECAGKAGSVSLFNVQCYNSAVCRTLKEGIERLGPGRCESSSDVTFCGAPCTPGGSAPHCVQLVQAATYSRGVFKCDSPPSNLAYSFTYIHGYDNRTYTDLDAMPPPALIEITTPSTPGTKSTQEFAPIFVNTTNKFRCRASSFLSNGEFIWKARHTNGSLFSPTIASTRPIHDYKKNQDSVWETEIRFEEPVTEIACFVPRWDTDTWVNLSVPLQIREPTRPVITNKGDNKRLEIGATGQTLSCQAMGDPLPELQWLRDGKVVALPFRTYQNDEGEVLEFPEMTQELAGEYECRATSIGGHDVGTFIAEAYDPPNITLYVGLGVTLLLLLIVILVVLWFKLRRAKQAIKYLTDEEVNWFKYGNPEAAKTAKEPHEMIINLPFNPEYEIDKERLHFDQGDVLGSGAFGVVYKGRLADFSNDVAIKTMKPYSELSYFKSLLSELKVMMYLGKHENIVQLIGAYTANIKERMIYIVVELSPYGNLETYLRFHQKEFNNLVKDDQICTPGESAKRDMYANLVRDLRVSSLSTSRVSATCQPFKGLSTADLVDWARQIANGMTHLEDQKVIHADLATRNVLLYENGVVKITDFGLSRQLYAYTTYLKKEQEPLPWRWMALESLREMNFSTQSDVWGYGVTLWEMFSLGAVPYPGLSWSVDFVEKLNHGLRLSRPFYSTTEIYEIMVACWHTESDCRPTFHELRNLFDGIKLRMTDPRSAK